MPPHCIRRVVSPEHAATEQSGGVLQAADVLEEALTTPLGHAAARLDDIIIHPEFRIFALANRPGFPFLCNAFFAECGSVFATHVIDNPDPASQARR